MHRCILFLSLIPILTISGQETESLITDRPDITESAVTVPVKTFQIETGFGLLYESESIDTIDFKTRNFSLASTLFRYGLFSSAELRVGTELLLKRLKASGITENISGISGLLIGAKVQLVRDHTDFPDAAIFFHFNLPVGTEDLKPDKIEPEIIAAASHSIGEPFSLSYNLGGTWDSSEEEVESFFSISLGIVLSDKWGSFIELYDRDTEGKKLDAGFTYLISENLQADASAGLGPSPDDNWFIGAGLSLRIPN